MDVKFICEKGLSKFNEDHCELALEAGLAIVCDGIGGKNGIGLKAAQIAAEQVSANIRKKIPTVEAENAALLQTKESRKFFLRELDAGIQNASTKIKLTAQDPLLAGMCTSLDILLWQSTHLFIAHVGAGRVYLVRNGESYQLTEDHTHYAHLKRLGQLETVPESEHLSLARRLTRAVGFEDEVRVDLMEVEVQAGDRFVAMSDGAWLVLGEERAEGLLSAKHSSEELLALIKNEAEKKGAKDNYSCLVLDIPNALPVAAEIEPEAKLKMLGKVPAFQYLSYQELIRVVGSADLLKVNAGHVIWNDGDPGGEMMLLLDGKVEVTKNGQRIRVLQKGDVFGEMSMIDFAPRSATVIATEKSNLLAFPRTQLFRLFREQPDLTIKFLWGVSIELNQRLRMASNKMVGRPEKEGLKTGGQGELPFHRSK